MGKPPLTALYVRIPESHSRMIDQLSVALGHSKQQVVTEILASGLTSAGLEESAPTSQTAEVLTLDQVAVLLGVSTDAVEDAVRSASLPARRIGDGWRFSKQAVLGWLATPDPSIKQRPGFTNRPTS